MSLRVLVTGVGGLLGSHVQYELARRGHQVFGVDNLTWGYRRNVLETTAFYPIDLRDGRTVERIVHDISPDVVYHLAADATENRSQFTPQSATSNNIMASVNVFTAAIKNKVQKIIFTSSIAVYGDLVPPFTEEMEPKPIDIYAINKRATEEILKVLCGVHSVDYVIFRPFNVFGVNQNLRDPYRNVIGIFMNRIMAGLAPTIYGDGQQTRAFSYIDNIIPPMVDVLEMSGGQTYNIGPERYITVNEMTKHVLDVMDSQLEPFYLPPRLHEVKNAFCDVSKARRLLGYEDKVSIEEGLVKMAEWAKTIGPQKFKYLNYLELEDNAPEVWRKKQL
jgi:UDP-glucose 4-epimerase